MITPVILSGGSGTRLWPLSRSLYPKQFLPLVTDNSLLQETLLRLQDLQCEKPVVVCNDQHRFLVAEQLRELSVSAEAILLEPVGRNTAPAVALAALQAAQHNPEALLLVLPADHVIQNDGAFLAAVEVAKQAALAGQLATFGIVPTAPETGYGYIKGAAKEGVSAVQQFVEKPDLATAQSYVDSGDFFWNSGMFLFRADRFLAELRQFAPDILKACEKALATGASDLDFVRVDSAEFQACPEDSIDYAVMEKTDQAVVVPLDAGWSDVGSWSALWEVAEKDEQGNHVHGDVLLESAENCFVHSSGKLIAAVGVSDLVVVETDDAVLVADRSQVQNVKAIVQRLKGDKRTEAVNHRKVYRPWGYYDSIDVGDRHQAKRIVVKPGARLSVQKHHHRAEHWIVVKGSALVTKDGVETLLTENESTYIPLGTIHCLENPGVIPLEMVEVQSGSYLGEDDIVRYDDKYGRA